MSRRRLRLHHRALNDPPVEVSYNFGHDFSGLLRSPLLDRVMYVVQFSNRHPYFVTQP